MIRIGSLPDLMTVRNKHVYLELFVIKYVIFVSGHISLFRDVIMLQSHKSPRREPFDQGL